ncbi:hypothetical protein J6590_053528 [Homalodisca vitripennis]|nr:hypothetical protein J6590_053528 [Homalodisca vitripennis]
MPSGHTSIFDPLRLDILFLLQAACLAFKPLELVEVQKSLRREPGRNYLTLFSFGKTKPTPTTNLQKKNKKETKQNKKET